MKWSLSLILRPYKAPQIDVYKRQELSDPKLVYIDEDKVKWIITDDDIETSVPAHQIRPIIPSSPVRPSVRAKHIGSANQTGTES